MAPAKTKKEKIGARQEEGGGGPQPPLPPPVAIRSQAQGGGAGGTGGEEGSHKLPLHYGTLVSLLQVCLGCFGGSWCWNCWGGGGCLACRVWCVCWVWTGIDRSVN